MNVAEITVTFEAVGQKRFLFESDNGTIYHGDKIDGSDAIPLKFTATYPGCPASRMVVLTLGRRSGFALPLPNYVTN